MLKMICISFPKVPIFFRWEITAAIQKARDQSSHPIMKKLAVYLKADSKLIKATGSLCFYFAQWFSLQIYKCWAFFPSFQVIMYILLPQQTMTFRTWQSICIFLCSNFFTACCHLPKKLHRFIMSVSLEIHFPWPSSFMQGKKVKYSGAWKYPEIYPHFRKNSPHLPI